MTNNFATIQSAIIAKLQALTKLKFVYAYEKGSLEGYPAITVYNSEYSASWETNSQDRDKYVFTLHLYQEMKQKTPANAEQIIDEALVEVIQAFQSDFTLSGAVDIMTIRATKGWASREVESRVAIITLTLEKLNLIA